MPKKIYIRTFGCQMNDRDSEAIEEMFRSQGYRLCDNSDGVDVVIFVTCSVREHAEDRVWGKLRMLARARRKKPVFVLSGCMAQEHKANAFKKLPAIDVVCGPANIKELPRLVKKALAGESRILAVDKKSRPVKKSTLPHKKGLKSASVNIMYGCSNFCSYCIVPYVRGSEISRPVESIITEIKDLVQSGTEEITLLGQNVNSYDGCCDFVQLLEKINAIKGIKRIKFITSHPKDAGEELFKAMKGLKGIAKQLHLPLQSGSDRILKLMNRRYTTVQYLGKIKLLRKHLPNVRLTTDVIVGFPTEKQADFKKTYNLMNKIKFDAAYIFKYSPRPPAKSSRMKDDVPLDVKKKRNQMLLELQRKLHKERV